MQKDQTELIRMQRRFRDLQDDHLLDCKSEYLKIVRRMKADEDGEATDEEVRVA